MRTPPAASQPVSFDVPSFTEGLPALPPEAAPPSAATLAARRALDELVREAATAADLIDEGIAEGNAEKIMASRIAHEVATLRQPAAAREVASAEAQDALEHLRWLGTFSEPLRLRYENAVRHRDAMLERVGEVMAQLNRLNLLMDLAATRRAKAEERLRALSAAAVTAEAPSPGRWSAVEPVAAVALRRAPRPERDAPAPPREKVVTGRRGDA